MAGNGRFGERRQGGFAGVYGHGAEIIALNRRKAGALAHTTGMTSSDAELALSDRRSTYISRAEAFLQAERHSRRVGHLKILLPVLAAMMASALVGYSAMSVPGRATVEPEGPAPTEGKLVMDAPRLEGFTEDGRPYSVNADRAIQDYDRQDIIDLEGVDARMPIEQTNWATVETSKGTYDRLANTLNVPTDIVVKTTDGLVARLQSAFLDINNGSLKTSTPVDIQSNGSRITADSMQVLDNGKLVVFEKRVKVHIDLARLRAAQAARGEANASN